jgi:rubrerythrin
VYAIPESRPTNMFEAFAYIGTVAQPTIEDLKLMVLLEAAGKAMYDDLAEDVEAADLKALLVDSGREEYLHAERVSRAIEILTGKSYPVPAAAQNPYMAGWVKPRLTRQLADSLAKAEAGGEQLYGRWASHCANDEISALFKQSGREETYHARRLEKISALLPA